jgi:hypothetical protein
MRINLVTPFAEKDAAKALGARWDATKKLWYIVDVADLTPFMRWIPDMQASAETLPTADSPPLHKAPIASKVASEVPHCGCDVLPWEACSHTPKP